MMLLLIQQQINNNRENENNNNKNAKTILSGLKGYYEILVFAAWLFILILYGPIRAKTSFKSTHTHNKEDYHTDTTD
ncbi:MAG: hypothetical protein M3P08_09230 [Thermoproteota archaeon]|nr:hypothetical protein [Thermoproteota archaeon]